MEMLVVSHFDNVMEPETISKNGASSKSQMSRGNFYEIRSSYNKDDVK